jgi:hypothetical protein
VNWISHVFPFQLLKEPVKVVEKEHQKFIKLWCAKKIKHQRFGSGSTEFSFQRLRALNGYVKRTANHNGHDNVK